MVTKTLESRLDLIVNSVLVTIYNQVADRQVSKFSDHSTAVKRTLAALEAKGKDIANDGKGNFTVVDAGKAPAPAAKAPRDGDDRKITVVADTNPKAKGSKSHKRFGLYKTGMTVADYVTAATKLGGGRRKAIRDITWDSAHGFIKLA
jgi:hypothetical protein